MENSPPSTLDVCIPTWESEDVLEGCLESLQKSIQESCASVDNLIVVDNNSDDATVEIAKRKADEYGWILKIRSVSSSLPQARQMAINEVEEEWFLFLDDDVRLSEPYISNHLRAVAPAVGAIQGRKDPQSGGQRDSLIRGQFNSNSDWVRKRAFRGGTHATMVRTAAAKYVQFPTDLEVWEDEYLRRHIESEGFLWIFNHQSLFVHETQNRHSASWNSGYLQAKYKLRPFWHVVLNIPYAAVTGGSLTGSVGMSLGYLKGKFDRRYR